MQRLSQVAYMLGFEREKTGIDKGGGGRRQRRPRSDPCREPLRVKADRVLFSYYTILSRTQHILCTVPVNLELSWAMPHIAPQLTASLVRHCPPAEHHSTRTESINLGRKYYLSW
jgi:hypothetical protein